MAPYLYSFIKITDNNNVADFCIECTRTRNPKARISALKSQLFNWEDRAVATGNDGKWRPVWDFFLKDYSFYVCERQSFDSLRDAREYRNVLAQQIKIIKKKLI